MGSGLHAWLTGILHLRCSSIIAADCSSILKTSPISKGAAIRISVGVLVAGWVVYDLLYGKFCKI